MATNALNCQSCRYRIWLARLCDCHVWAGDCDNEGTDLCKRMNDPEFIQFMKDQDK